jgi:hypothetical protein
MRASQAYNNSSKRLRDMIKSRDGGNDENSNPRRLLNEKNSYGRKKTLNENKKGGSSMNFDFDEAKKQMLLRNNKTQA